MRTVSACNLLEEVIRMYGMKANGVNDIYSEGKEVLEKAEKNKNNYIRSNRNCPNTCTTTA